MTNILIESLGVYLPGRAVTTKEVISNCHSVVRYPLERLTGIESRRVADEQEFSIDLAKQAIESCLARSRYEAADIDLVICCNISRYDRQGRVIFEPSTAAQLKAHFSFDNALCFDISNACAGMFTAVNTAETFIKADMAQRVLVVSGEYITHLTNTVQKEITESKDDRRLACLTLGDSGAAVILEKAPAEDVGFRDIEMFTISDYSDLCIASPSPEEHGGYVMVTESAKLHEVAIAESIKFVVEKMRKHRWFDRPLKHFVMHQTARTAIHQTASGIGKLIDELIGDSLWQATNIINNLRHRGNTSTTSHFVALWDKILDGDIVEGDSVLFAVQASGITLGAASYTLDDLPSRLRNGNQVEKNASSPGCQPIAVKPRTRTALLGWGTADPASDTPSSIRLASDAIKQCLQKTGCPNNDVDLLINAGVYRDKFLVEPAVSTLIAGEVDLNSGVDDWRKAKTFAFDLGNGAAGFLSSCYAAQASVASGKYNRAMVVSSEIENNAVTHSDDMVGLRQCGSAALIGRTEGEQGFRRFHFVNYGEHLNLFGSEVVHEPADSYLHIEHDPAYHGTLLDCIPHTVRELLDAEGITLADIDLIIPPQVSGDFLDQLADKLQVSGDKLVRCADSIHDYYTSSTIYGLSAADEQGLIEDGKLALIIEAGSGIMVATALYQF